MNNQTDEYFEELYTEMMLEQMEYETENYLWVIIAQIAKHKIT